MSFFYKLFVTPLDSFVLLPDKRMKKVIITLLLLFLGFCSYAILRIFSMIFHLPDEEEKPHSRLTVDTLFFSNLLMHPLKCLSSFKITSKL